MRDRPRLALAVLVVAVALTGCLTGNGGTLQRQDTPASAPSFRDALILDTQGDETGNEPSLAITPEGTVFVCSPRGTGRGTNVWRSMDGGASFQRLGDAAHPAIGPRRSATGDVGGGDCHLGFDKGGTLYLADLWAAGVSIAWTNDQGQTWDGRPVSQITGTSDRPWILGGEPGEVFMAVTDIHGTIAEIATEFLLGVRGAPSAGGIYVARSMDGGKTFPQQVLAVSNKDRFYPSSNLAWANGSLYLYYILAEGEDRALHMVAISKDHGLTWSHKLAAEQPYDRNLCGTYPFAVFPVVAADETGGVYLASVYANPETERLDLVLIASPDQGESWNEPVMVADRPGTRAYPWMAAAGGGRIGVAWYESNQTLFPDTVGSIADRTSCGSQGDEEESDWFVRYADIQGAASSNPAITETLVQSAPVNRSASLGRPFAEFLQVAFDPQRRAAVVYVSDTDSALGRPMFALQADSRPSG